MHATLQILFRKNRTTDSFITANYSRRIIYFFRRNHHQPHFRNMICQLFYSLGIQNQSDSTPINRARGSDLAITRQIDCSSSRLGSTRLRYIVRIGFTTDLYVTVNQTKNLSPRYRKYDWIESIGMLGTGVEDATLLHHASLESLLPLDGEGSGAKLIDCGCSCTSDQSDVRKDQNRGISSLLSPESRLHRK